MTKLSNVLFPLIAGAIAVALSVVLVAALSNLRKPVLITGAAISFLVVTAVVLNAAQRSSTK